MALTQRTSTVSDTVRVTPDGTIFVDAEKLLNKPHIRKMIDEIRAKTKVVRKKRDSRFSE